MIEEAYRKIKNLEVQGATNVALFALKTVEEYAKKEKEIEKIKRAIKRLMEARPTEPLAINALSSLLRLSSCREIEKNARKWQKRIEEGMRKVVEIGAEVIPEEATVQTICHSSTVVEILAKARDMGKEIKAVVTETRPRYQGRKTAWELYQRNVPVVLYVDSAMFFAMKKEKVDMVLTGFDAIFADGSIANKIGTGLLALVAENLEVPFYSAGLSLKFDFSSRFSQGVEIEERDPREIWSYPIEIRNPAFEIVPASRIKGLITELGVLSPATASFEILKKYSL